jgi:hypothetical protein
MREFLKASRVASDYIRKSDSAETVDGSVDVRQDVGVDAFDSLGPARWV